MRTKGSKGVPVVVYNDRLGIKQTFQSKIEAARVLDVDASQVYKASKTGQWVFAKGGAFKIAPQPFED